MGIFSENLGVIITGITGAIGGIVDFLPLKKATIPPIAPVTAVIITTILSEKTHI